jgi:glycerol-3-phosphate dehydrogenase
VPTLASHERIRDHADAGADGLLTVAGTKYTTARAVAERVVDRVLQKLGRQAGPCRTAIVPLPGGDLGDVSETIAGARRRHDARLPSDTIPHLVSAYGSRFDAVLALGNGRPEWLARVAGDSPVIGAELAWAARHEMVVTLADAVVRRTPLGAMGYPGEAAAAAAADIVGSELGWGESRKREEIESLRRFYETT